MNNTKSNMGDVDDNASMYLSFDSTVSSVSAFKTLEATTDISMGCDQGNLSTLNSTLEANTANMSSSNQLNTVKRVEALNTLSPLRAFPKNILNVVSSTPSKEQIMRNVDLIRGSDPDRANDMCLEFQRMEEGKRIGMPIITEENKENAQPETDASTMSCSSLTEAVTAIERKLKSSSTDEESMPSSKEEQTEKITELKVEVKNKVAMKDLPSLLKAPQPISKGKRKSLCVPNLQTNRPSRIILNASKKRQSLAVAKVNRVGGSPELPKLMEEMLKISDKAVEQATQSHNEKPKEVIVAAKKTRTSLIPTSSQAEKRPLGFTQRMSIVVRTTLNSPARKIPRKSVAFSSQQTQTTSGMGAARPSKMSTRDRRSLLPLGRGLKVTAPTVVPKICVLAPPEEGDADNKTDNVDGQPSSQQSQPQRRQTVFKGPLPPKPFACSVCGEKFRIKSLLDGHKRSHELDITPIFGKKPSQAPASSTQKVKYNECKYCDKKFALERALHIHLLQNCVKISANEKRKLEFTEMDHVKKAQLPHFSGHGSSSSIGVGGAGISKFRPKSPVSSTSSNVSPRGSSDSLVDHSNGGFGNRRNVNNAREVMPPPPPGSTSKVKKSKAAAAAHAGVYRTPTKEVPCYVCKKTFKNVLEYTNHCMTKHSPTDQEVENESQE